MSIVIDVSSWQGPLVWAAIARAWQAGDLGGIIMRAGVGRTGGAVADIRLKTNQAAARALGIPRAYYLFARPDLGSGAEQGRALVDLVGPLQAGEGLILDLEAAPLSVPWAMDFNQAVLAAARVVPIMYLGAANLNDRTYDWSPVRDLGCPLWVAAYGSNDGAPHTPPRPGPWPTWALWQYTSTASRTDITPGNLDASTLRPGLTLDQLGYQPSKEPPTMILPTVTEVSSFIARAYRLRGNTDDNGQLYWIAQVCQSDTPWGTLAEMETQLGPVTTTSNPTPEVIKP